MSTNIRLSNLIEDDIHHPNKPPQTGPEIDDLNPSSESGIDDGFLPNPGRGKNEFDLDDGPPPGATPPDLNVYQQKKTLAQGMMDLALLSANANQLRYVLESKGNIPYYYSSLALISISLILQIGVGVMLIWNSTYNVKKYEHLCRANRINNLTVISIFIVTITNVFISVFAVNSIDYSGAAGW